MALLFGETNIPSSRAFWDDFENEIISLPTIEKLQLQIISNNAMEKAISAAEHMLVVEGKKILKFAQNILLQQATKLATIPGVCFDIYYTNKQKMFIVIVEEDLSNSGEKSEILINLFRVKNVITLSIRPQVEFNKEIPENKFTVLRSIGKNTNVDDNIKQLEPPNFISGVVAGIASWRQNAKLDFECYVAYTDNIYLDTGAAKPVVDLLESRGIPCCHNYSKRSINDFSHVYF